jgi:hypothetical protein
VKPLRARLGPRYRWLLLLSVMIGTMASIMSSTVVNVAKVWEACWSRPSAGARLGRLRGWLELPSCEGRPAGPALLMCTHTLPHLDVRNPVSTQRIKSCDDIAPESRLISRPF